MFSVTKATRVCLHKKHIFNHLKKIRPRDRLYSTKGEKKPNTHNKPTNPSGEADYDRPFNFKSNMVKEFNEEMT